MTVFWSSCKTIWKIEWYILRKTYKHVMIPEIKWMINIFYSMALYKMLWTQGIPKKKKGQTWQTQVQREDFMEMFCLGKDEFNQCTLCFWICCCYLTIQMQSQIYTFPFAQMYHQHYLQTVIKWQLSVVNSVLYFTRLYALIEKEED